LSIVSSTISFKETGRGPSMLSPDDSLGVGSPPLPVVRRANPSYLLSERHVDDKRP
jgi:hypothetical protein